jgi:hypothetical protein
MLYTVEVMVEDQRRQPKDITENIILVESLRRGRCSRGT